MIRTLALIPLAAALAHADPGPTESRLLLGGNFPDVTVLRDGDKYYMTHSSFDYRPGLLIWESDDLRTWRPLTYAIRDLDANVWAPDLIKHDDTYFLYFPALVDGKATNHVTTAKDPAGPWSEPRSVGIGKIDPGHVVAEDGTRHLHLSGGHVVEMKPDGLQVKGESRKVLEGWPIPEDWAIECFCLESPKLTRRDGWYYLTAAQGGTFGPSTSHMTTSFRSRDATGPWEISPHNPVIRTWSRDERWWSKGHSTLVEGPGGRWFSIHHGIRNGYRSAGRSTLIEPVEWTEDGWWVVADQWPEGYAESDFSIEMPLADEFDGDQLGIQWQFHRHYEPDRFRFEDGALVLEGRGDSPGRSRPLAVNPRHLAYEIETEVTVTGDGQAGLILFGSPGGFIGYGLDGEGRPERVQEGFKRYRYAKGPRQRGNTLGFRIVNDHQDVRFYVREPGGEWTIVQPSIDIACTPGMRAALFATGDATARFESFRYQPLETR